jgi:hypothetical protein
MQKSVEKPTNSGKRDEHKQQWLTGLGLEEDKSVIDCDPDAQQVTVMVDGEPRVRQLVECWTRVMGYHRPLTSFNIGKREEHRERLHFSENAAMRSMDAAGV